MKKLNRLIPVLLLKNDLVYKTIKFKNPKYIGDPINTVKIFNDKGADEIIILDTLVSRNKKEPNYDLLKNILSECFMPVCYGGGISNLDISKKIFDLGVEKISIKTALFNNNYKNIINDIAKIYGSQAIVSCIDIKKNLFGKYFIISNDLKIKYKLNIINFINSLIDNGVGEILLQFVDNDGVMNGQDLNFIRYISESISVPLISLGGIGSNDNIKMSINYGADAVAAGSFFVFNGPHNAVLISYKNILDLE